MVRINNLNDLLRSLTAPEFLSNYNTVFLDNHDRGFTLEKCLNMKTKYMYYISFPNPSAFKIPSPCTHNHSREFSAKEAALSDIWTIVEITTCDNLPDLTVHLGRPSEIQGARLVSVT